MDLINFKIFWTQLVALATEQARALQRTAFSPIVRESGDLAVGICDPAGRMIANAATGAPGHINTIGNVAEACLREIPIDTLEPGDILITNDPWAGVGHFFDITVLAPIFKNGKLIAFIGSCIHHTDIGGIGIGAGARDVHEEGLWIPPLKLYAAGQENKTLFNIIRRNVREPTHVVGDLAAQTSCGRVGGARLVALCERYGLDDLAWVSEEILSRSENATRQIIRKLPGGVYHGKTVYDLPWGEEVTLQVALHVDADKGEILADFAGSSPASASGINVIPGYAHAYVRFAVKSCLAPDLPNNDGSMLPVKFSAPRGSILNAEYPSPVSARHIVGHYVPTPVINALYHVVPENVLAECAGGIWGIQINGFQPDGRPFMSSLVTYSGGMGARASKPGLSTTGYPGGTSSIPLEMLEATMPIEFVRKELAHGSEGRGRKDGGAGQRVEFRMRTNRPWMMNATVSRMTHGPKGLGGGGDGAPGSFSINGKPLTAVAKVVMQPSDRVVLQTPGGGGYGSSAAGR